MHSQSPRSLHSRRMVMFAGFTALLGGLVLIVQGGLNMDNPTSVWFFTAGFAAWIIAFVAIAAVEVLLKIESNTQRQHGELLDLREEVTRYSQRLDEIVAAVSISDAAKSIAHRDRELDALRQAVRDDIRAHRWDTAMYLVAEMQRRFGIEDEAAKLRHEVSEARAEIFRQRLQQALDHVEECFEAKHWILARKEIDRLHRVLPDEPRVSGLYEAMERRRQAHKSELLESWSEALRRDDIDGGIEILKELDQYLTRDESVGLESSARDVFKRKLLQLRFLFQYAVGEQRWSDALQVGSQIMHEYPNSRMAFEIRDKLTVLRLRAGLPADGEPATSRITVTPVPIGHTEPMEAAATS